MYILNIQVIQQNEIIKITFDSLAYEEKLHLHRVNIYEIMRQKFYYSQPDLLDNEINCIASDNHNFIMKINNERVVVTKSTVSYQLPTRTHFALDFLDALFYFLNNTKYHHIVLNNYCIDDQLVNTGRGSHPIESRLMLSIDKVLGKSALIFTLKNCISLVNSIRLAPQQAINFFSSTFSSSPETKVISSPIDKMVATIIEKIISFDLLEYRSFVNTITSLQAWSKKNNCHLTKALSIKQRFAILATDMKLDAVYSAKEITTKMQALYRLLRHFLREERFEDLNHLVDNYVYELKKQLFHKCISKNNLYRWNSPEWAFLHDAEFRIRSDGCVSIKVENNQGYQKNYNLEGDDDSVFINHLQRLAEILGWTFAECNFHDEIIFTESCSQALMEKGFHYNLPYLKNLLQVKNLSSLFQQANKYQFNKNNEENMLSYLPRDILELIAHDVFKNMQPNLCTEEVAEMKRIGWKC